MIMAENLGVGSGISSGKEYLETLRNLLKKSKMPYQFDSDISVRRIGNKQFDYLPVSIKRNGVTVGQYYFSVIKRNFALSVIISFFSEEQKYQLEEIINQIKFD